MKIKFIPLACVLLWAGAQAFGQSSPIQNGVRQKSLPVVSCAALWISVLTPANRKADLPPFKAELPPPKAEIPPVQTQNQEEMIQLPRPLDTASTTDSSKPAQAASTPSSSEEEQLARANTDYTIWQYGFIRRTYENQLIQTRIIFVLVLALVSAGLFFSWLQFQHSLHLKHVIKSRVAVKGDATDEPASPPDEFAFGKDGVVIRSAYLGVIILVISMAFFFLYLKFVYPIN